MDTLEPGGAYFLAAFVLGIPAAWILAARGRTGGLLPRAEPVVRPRGAPWFLGVLLLYLVFIVLGVVVLLGYRALAAGRMPRGAGVSFEDLLVLDFAAKGLAAGAFFLVHRIRRSPVRLVRPDPSPGRSAAGGFLAGLAFLPVLMATGFLQDLVYRRCGWRVEPQDLVVKAVRGSPGSFAMVAFFVVAGAPLFEEFAFRGLLHSGLRTRLGPRAATLLAAAVFAGYHLQVDALPVLFLFGIWLSLLRERTGGLTAPIAAHACYNAFQMVGVWMARPGG